MESSEFTSKNGLRTAKNSFGEASVALSSTEFGALSARRFDVRVDRLEIPSKTLFVVRDDLLPGGTKERACRSFLESLDAQGNSAFVYASPFCGFAQVALARAASSLGREAVLFAARDPFQKGSCAHEYTRLAESFGATVFICQDLKEATVRAIAYAKASSDCLVPLGFDHPSFRAELIRALKDVWGRVLAESERPPQALWLPVGSGTLAKCMRQVVSREIELKLVNVNVLSEEDSRIMEVMKLPNSSYVRAQEKFEERCENLPPVPSNLHYDAKLWRLLVREGKSGDVWWNVAR
jgi:hypothetical protein